jgi:protein gp37
MSNPIGWCTDTINPITGCLNGCEYCYARKMAFRLRGRFGYPEDDPFKPTFHPDKLQDIYNLRGAGKRVFLDSMSDWFSEGVKPDWIKQSLEAVEIKPEHTFLVLTKRPDNIPYQQFPANLWLGVSVTCQNDVYRIECMLENVKPDTHTFVSFEPLHGPISCDLFGIDWVIIGAESGNRKGKIVPKGEWIWDLMTEADYQKIPIFLKDNIKPYAPFSIP